MAQHEPIRKRPAPGQEIPDKLYFRIGEVAKLCDVPAYVLRFWESEFVQLKPNKGGTGQRLYRRRDVETALRVKELLYDEGYTIAGARQALKIELRSGKDLKETQIALADAEARTSVADGQHLRLIQSMQKELRDLHAMLLRPPVKSAVHPIRGGRPLPVPLAAVKPKSAVKAFPRLNQVQKQPGLYDSFDRLFDSLPDAEREDQGTL